MTSDDLTFTLRKQTSRPSFWYIIHHLLTKSEICFFSEFWPQVTFYDLVTLFIRKLKSRASLWYTIYPLSMTLEIWPIFGIFDLGWPLLTSWSLFLKSWRQERHFDIHFIHFRWLLKYDLFSEFLTSGDLCWPRDPFFWKADVKRVILIYNLPTFNDFWNLTLNDPKFEIWP